MIFSSGVFLLLYLPLMLLIYYNPVVTGRKFKNLFLFFGSCLFYAYGEPIYICLILMSILFNWMIARCIDRYEKEKRILFGMGILFNIILLFLFKYLAFIQNIVNDLFKIDIMVSNVILPIGISFYTFQAISYLIDVYSGKEIAQKSIINVGLYIAFFPQLIAGPIVRYNTIAYEIEHRNESYDNFYYGIRRFLIGMGKKVLIANQIAIVADRAFSLPIQDLSTAMAWLGAVAYTLQIYFDFSGYSDMAIGLGRMFGFHFLENFHYPYISTSITEFWRRWHISLSSWFRDYIYIPLGGNRGGIYRQLFNMFIVWLLTGLWHGANWTFLCWGIFYFLLLLVEKVFGCMKGMVGYVYTIVAVIIGWVIFRSQDVLSAMKYIKTMFCLSNVSVFDEMFKTYAISFKVVLLIGVLACMPIAEYFGKQIKGNNYVYRILTDAGIFMIGILAFCFIIGESYSPFIYFNF